MKLKVERHDLAGDLDTTGPGRSWRDRIRTFCRQQALAFDFLAREAVRIFSPDLDKREAKRRVKQMRANYGKKKTPSVCQSLRRLVAHLARLVKRGFPIPLEAETA